MEIVSWGIKQEVFGVFIMKTVPVRYRLPVAYTTEIGRFVTRWAYLEWLLKETAYVLLQMDPKIGRLSVQELGVGSYLTMLEDIAVLKDIQVSIKWKELRKILQEMESFRNKIVHGIWVKDSSTKTPVLQQVKGSYKPEPGKKSVNAKIKPRGIKVSLKELKNAIKGIDRANQIIHEMKDEIEANSKM